MAARRWAAIVLGMLHGTLLHHWLATGFAAFTFLLVLKLLIAPHLPQGAQKLVLAA